ncbi:tropinone reductase 2-like [Lingula anatina]|uniref:Tropinone reductase 2-like n=1 Tax=Lingula anatina TaxID=7574 RepID=A0A1S3JFI1_LINAN|nr:tropinone reductase 2-like [Lingula anatina]|eukprot:XP_013409172.1 tropinone reductase 2-like [Lingula anatina]
MASTGAHLANKNAWVYHASKGAGLQMTRCMALDLSKDGIRVNSVSPAAIWTQTIGKMVNNDKDFHRTTWGKFHMLKRCGESAEVAAVVAFLCSRDAGFITGADIKVDGGYTTIGPERHGEEVGVKLAVLSKEPKT